MIFLIIVLLAYVLPMIAVFVLDRKMVVAEITEQSYGGRYKTEFRTPLTTVPRGYYDERSYAALFSCALIPLVNIGTAGWQVVDSIDKRKIYRQGRKFKDEITNQKIDDRLDTILAARAQFQESRIKELEKKAYQ